MQDLEKYCVAVIPELDLRHRKLLGHETELKAVCLVTSEM